MNDGGDRHIGGRWIMRFGREIEMDGKRKKEEAGKEGSNERKK